MQEWEKTAKRLPCGRHVRVRCCKDDLSRIISHTEKGYSTYCFRCGKQPDEFIGHGALSLAERLRMQKDLDEYVKSETIKLPDDFTLEIPDKALAWPLSYGINDDVCRGYGFGWSEKLNRFVMPVYDDNDNLKAVQSRAIDGFVPKYLNRGKYLFWSLDSSNTDYVVITEDMLSTVKVGFCAKAVSTLGTSISTKNASTIVKRYRKIYVWYDNDEAGMNGAKKVRKELMMQGADVRIIHTEEDPKAYTRSQIKDILDD